MEIKEFPCSSEGVVAAQSFLELRCDEPKPAIILDEIVSNIVRCSGASGFTISIDRQPESLTMVFTDDGKPFDPTREIAAPDVTAAVEDREIGGLGMFMVRKMSKSVGYERKGDRNVLRVVI